MGGILYIADPVVTEEILGQKHQGQDEVRIHPRTVITPTGWDYIRRHRLHLRRGEAAGLVESPGAEEGRSAHIEGSRLVQEGRCGHPEQACGCQTEEFGSGFVEPSSCRECPIHKLEQEGRPNAGCQGCNRYKTIQDLVDTGQAVDIEALVQQITDQIMARFEG